MYSVGRYLSLWTLSTGICLCTLSTCDPIPATVDLSLCPLSTGICHCVLCQQVSVIMYSVNRWPSTSHSRSVIMYSVNRYLSLCIVNRYLSLCTLWWSVIMYSVNRLGLGLLLIMYSVNRYLSLCTLSTGIYHQVSVIMYSVSRYLSLCTLSAGICHYVLWQQVSVIVFSVNRWPKATIPDWPGHATRIPWGDGYLPWSLTASTPDTDFYRWRTVCVLILMMVTTVV